MSLLREITAPMVAKIWLALSLICSPGDGMTQPDVQIALASSECPATDRSPAA